MGKRAIETSKKILRDDSFERFSDPTLSKPFELPTHMGGTTIEH